MQFIKLQPRDREFAIFVPQAFYEHFRELLNTNAHPVDVTISDQRDRSGNMIFRDANGQQFKPFAIVVVFIATQLPTTD